jgi:hemolysin-activating ACP:hemolysin acyltransferase
LLTKAIVDALFLFNQSPDHRQYSLVDFNTFCIHPLLNNSAHVFYENGKPVGFSSWCWFSNREAEDFLQERWVPDEKTYKRATGDQFWGIEFIAPYNPPKRFIRYMMFETRRRGTGITNTKQLVHWRRLKAPYKLHRKEI